MEGKRILEGHGKRILRNGVQPCQRNNHHPVQPTDDGSGGRKGVAAISAILYLQFIFIAVFFGFVSGISPVVSYNYGAENRDNIKKTFNISIKIVVIFSGTMFALAEIFDGLLVWIFASKDPVLSELMIYGFRIIAISILFSGLNIFASGFLRLSITERFPPSSPCSGPLSSKRGRYCCCPRSSALTESGGLFRRRR